MGDEAHLRVLDDRSSPDLIRSVVRKAVEAWIEAIDGPVDHLESLASESAVDALLYGDDQARETRVVVRGLVVQRMAIVAIDADGSLGVEVDAHGGAYAEDRRSWTVVSGSRSARRRCRRRWTLELAGDADRPWRVARVT